MVRMLLGAGVGALLLAVGSVQAQDYSDSADVLPSYQVDEEFVSGGLMTGEESVFVDYRRGSRSRFSAPPSKRGPVPRFGACPGAPLARWKVAPGSVCGRHGCPRFGRHSHFGMRGRHYYHYRGWGRHGYYGPGRGRPSYGYRGMSRSSDWLRQMRAEFERRMRQRLAPPAPGRSTRPTPPAAGSRGYMRPPAPPTPDRRPATPPSTRRPTPPAAPAPRLADIERRLDQIAREVESLRRELRRR